MNKKTLIGFGFGLVTAAMAAAPLTAFAHDNGGNGEGQLAVYASNPSPTTSPTTNIQLGGTYYIELLNPGGNPLPQNIKSAPNEATFNFIHPSVNLQGNPGNWSFTTTFTVDGTLVSGSHYVYKITLPAQEPKGYYTIETGPLQMNTNSGEDEEYFTNDPSIGGTGTTVQGYDLTGQLPEVPYAGLIPMLAILGGGYVFLRRRRNRSA